jgi:hypothetical protein
VLHGMTVRSGPAGVNNLAGASLMVLLARLGLLAQLVLLASWSC